VPRTHNSFGDRSFGAAGPRIWNSLPCGLRTLDISYKHFKTLQKMFGPQRFVTFYISAVEILLPNYLLTYHSHVWAYSVIMGTNWSCQSVTNPSIHQSFNSNKHWGACRSGLSMSLKQNLTKENKTTI